MASLKDDPKVQALVDKATAAATKAEKKRIAENLKAIDFTDMKVGAIKKAIKDALQ